MRSLVVLGFSLAISAMTGPVQADFYLNCRLMSKADPLWSQHCKALNIVRIVCRDQFGCLVLKKRILAAGVPSAAIQSSSNSNMGVQPTTSARRPASTTASNVGSAVSSTGSNVGSAVSSTSGALGNGIAATGNGLGGAVQGAGSAAGNAVGGPVGSVASGTANAVGSTVQGTGQAAGGAVNRTGSTVGNTVSGVGETGGAVVSGAGRALGL
jgi:hypothetical protein